MHAFLYSALHMRFLLVGNYGVGNLGDEALKDFFLRSFPEVEWAVLSAHPQSGELPRLPLGLRSLLSPWWKTLGELSRSKGIVFGGGSLFTDTESVFACILWWWHAFVAFLLGKHILLAYQGIGPFQTSLGERLTRWVVKRAAFVSVRDEQSFARVQAWELSTKVVLSFDPVFSLLQAMKSENSAQNIFIAIPRRNSGNAFRGAFQKHVAERSWNAVWVLSLQPDSSAEQRLCEELAEASEGSIVPIRSLEELAAQMNQASFVLSERYHGALAAIALGKEFEVIPQQEGDKLSSLRNVSTAELQRRLEEGTAALRAMVSNMA
jgi:polysaccharide pyruvyl transferase WcaK-like protein